MKGFSLYLIRNVKEIGKLTVPNNRKSKLKDNYKNTCSTLLKFGLNNENFSEDLSVIRNPTSRVKDLLLGFNQVL